MKAQGRFEKYQGMTLIVQNGWINIVQDSTGFAFEGPVTDDDDVRRVARTVIPVLLTLGGQS